MRVLNRFVTRQYAAWRGRSRRQEIRAKLLEHFGTPVKLVRGGSRGRDDVFMVELQSKVVGALRLSNPHFHRKALNSNLPFMTLGTTDRLNREWHCYEIGFQYGLTPKPLWRDEGALMCEYIHGQRMSTQLAASPLHFWKLVAHGASVLADLHQSGLVHMDASLANMIAPNTGQTSTVLIDFEYAPNPRLDEYQQQAYDHLRLVESGIKFVPEAIENSFEPWLETLERRLTRETRRADLSALELGLTRILSKPKIASALAEVFTDKATLSRFRDRST